MSSTWYPLSDLSSFAQHIDDGLAHAEEHLRTLEEGRVRPYELDDATVARIVRVFTTEAEDLDLFEGQIARWKNESPTAKERAKLDRLTDTLTRHRKVIVSILSLARELQTKTIERLLETDDATVGLEYLARFSRH